MEHIVAYKLPKADQKLRLRFLRELYGFDDYSNRGSYRYYRRGILASGDYEKVARGVLLIRAKLELVIAHLKNYRASYRAFEVSQSRNTAEKRKRKKRKPA